MKSERVVEGEELVRRKLGAIALAACLHLGMLLSQRHIVSTAGSVLCLISSLLEPTFKRRCQERVRKSYVCLHMVSDCSVNMTLVFQEWVSARFLSSEKAVQYVQPNLIHTTFYRR